MIDLHCHLLPGIDDGPSTMEDSVALARAAAEAGTRTIVATPHVNWTYRNDSRTIARLIAELGARLTAESVAIDIRPGAEIAMTSALEMTNTELGALRLGGGQWLLIECPLTPTATGFDSVLLDLQAAGHRILLAHPERCPAFQRNPDSLRRLVHAGMLTSLTASAFGGSFGSEVRRFANKLIREELVHNIASDAHNVLRRPPVISAELERAGLASLEEWLTLSVPRAILDGDEIPARPPVSLPVTKSVWRRRLRRR
ncbi:MAG TPA: CpsB/CapC family capsule biosynthesis tyrosine phosphatase [Solirubrobacteraceae bacterium]